MDGFVCDLLVRACLAAAKTEDLQAAKAYRPACRPTPAREDDVESSEEALEEVPPTPSAPSRAQVTVYRSQKASGERWQKVREFELDDDGAAGAQAQAPSVFVCPNAPVSKPFLGFGGSFTEASAVTLQKMSREKQEEVLRAYFDPETGHGYSLGRIHMGSCDFSYGNWMCGDLTEGDMELTNFSIERYQSAMLPMMRRAAELAGRPTELLVSPWSPPPWMKTNGRFDGGGSLLPECRGAWALHFVRFVKALEQEGIPVWGVSVQNEPEAAQVWESCIYTAEEERDFVRDHLGPALAEAGLGAVKIIIHDHNRDAMLERAAIAYDDEQAANYIWGVGYHWYGDARFEIWPERTEVPFQDRQKANKQIYETKAQAGFDNVRRVAELRPDKHIIFTEGCQELGERPLSSVLGDWKLGERYAMNIIADLNSGCEGWIDWNLCLDDTGGPNHVHNLCVAPVICDTKSDLILYQPAFWYLGHFSRHILPGARRVACSSSRDVLEVTAFRNEDGSVAIVVMNQSEDKVDFWLKVSGHGGANVEAPPRSITTFVITFSQAIPQ